MDRDLQKIQKKIVPVEKNGLCILNAMQRALKDNGVSRTIEQLINSLKEEIQKNASKYQTFSEDDVDVKAEIEKFISDPVKAYVEKTVDLVLPALSSALNVKATVFQINSSGKILTLPSIRNIKDFEVECFFARTQVLHVDPVVELRTDSLNTV